MASSLERPSAVGIDGASAIPEFRAQFGRLGKKHYVLLFISLGVDP